MSLKLSGAAPATAPAVGAAVPNAGTAVTAAGLDAAALGALVQDDAVKAELVANTDAAVARGAFGVPTFFLNGEMWFGKDRLRDVVEAAGG